MLGSMQRLIRRAGTGMAAVALAVVGGLAFTAAPAAAHTEAGAITNACGSGYSVVSDGRRDVRTATGTLYGYVVLTYNAATGNNCVVTYKHNNSPYHEVSTRMVACLDVQGAGGTPCDGGNFLHWVERTRNAADTCVAYWAYIYSQPDGAGTQAVGGRLTWGNCG